MNTNPTQESEHPAGKVKFTKSSHTARIGILGVLCLSLALFNWSKEREIRKLKAQVTEVQITFMEENEKGYLQAIWDAYFEKTRYVIDDSKTEPVLWKQVNLDQEVKDRVTSFKQQMEAQMEEGPEQN